MHFERGVNSSELALSPPEILPHLIEHPHRAADGCRSRRLTWRKRHEKRKSDAVLLISAAVGKEVAEGLIPSA